MNKWKCTTDTSYRGLGAVLSQEVNGEWRPLLYLNRKLTAPECKYSTIKKSAWQSSGPSSPSDIISWDGNSSCAPTMHPCSGCTRCESRTPASLVGTWPFNRSSSG